MAILEHVKSYFFPINVQLLKLKLAFFLVYSIWFSGLPYVSIMMTQIITYQQLAILFSCIPVISIAGPIVTGFIADKLGNYKLILIFGVLLGGSCHIPILWLYSDYQKLMADLETQQSFNESLSQQNQSAAVEWTPSTVPQHDYTFPVLIGIRILGYISLDMANTLLDASGLTMTKKHGGDFAKQKLWGPCSLAVIPFICGLLIDAISKYQGFKDYSIALYISAGFAVVVTPLILSLEMEVEKNRNSALTTLKKVGAMIDVDIFILVQVVVGICLGFHLNFYPVYLANELSGTNSLLGITLSLNGIGTMIILNFAKVAIIDRIGEANTVIIGLTLYCIRFAVFYFLQHSWVMLITESLDGFTGFLCIVSGSYYCQKAAPPGMLASLNGILASATFGAGRGIGTTVGSTLISKYGMRMTYLCGSIVAGATAVIYCAAYHLYLKKKEAERIAAREKDSNEVCGVDNPASDVKEEDVKEETKTSVDDSKGNEIIV